MTALGIFVRLETKSGNPHGYDGSMRVKAAKQHSQNLCACRQHGNWPGFWQPAPVHGCPFCMTCYSQSDSSSTPSAISSISLAAARIGIRVALPSVEGMFAMRLVRAITDCFFLRWSRCLLLLLDSIRQFALKTPQ
jgi:hypothetical protein